MECGDKEDDEVQRSDVGGPASLSVELSNEVQVQSFFKGGGESMMQLASQGRSLVSRIKGVPRRFCFVSE